MKSCMNGSKEFQNMIWISLLTANFVRSLGNCFVGLEYQPYISLMLTGATGRHRQIFNDKDDNKAKPSKTGFS